MSNQRGLEDLFKKHLFSCGFRYSYKYLYQKRVKSHVTTYIDMEDLIQWIMQVGQFRRQTELVDLYSYLSLANKKKADTAWKMYKDIIKSSNIGYNPEIVPEAVLIYK